MTPEEILEWVESAFPDLVSLPDSGPEKPEGKRDGDDSEDDGGSGLGGGGGGMGLGQMVHEVAVSS